MVEEKEEGLGCFGTIFIAALFAFIIGAGVNYFFGAGTIEFGTIFKWTFGATLVLGAIIKLSAIMNNNKLREASKIEAERIIADEKEKTQED
jgi:hypothetical protein